MERLTLARNAMATRFELVLLGNDPVHMRAAGEEALDEISRIESQLSIYQPSSELARVNRQAATEPVRVSPPVFQFLQTCATLSELTGGRFDISIAPLVRCWGFMRGNGSRPSAEQIAETRQKIGMDLVELDAKNSTVRFAWEGMMLDPGSIGKGYALEEAAKILREANIENALLHGGTSTICAIGCDSEGPWKVAIEQPDPAPNGASQALAFVALRDSALSVSAVWGKSFEIDGQTYGHVIDPRTGWPAEQALLGAALIRSAMNSDALSTAVLLAEPEDLPELELNFPELSYLQLSRDGKTVCRGIKLAAAPPTMV